MNILERLRPWLPLPLLGLFALATLTGPQRPDIAAWWRWAMEAGGAMALLEAPLEALSEAPLEALVVSELYLPRWQAALLIGAALGCAGCLLQRLTANPLASPGLLGLNQGAALGLVCLLVSPWPFTLASAWLAAMAGAALAMLLVFGIVRLATGGLPIDGLLLFGALFGTLLGALATLLLLIDQHALDVIRFWLAGSLAPVVPEQIGPLARVVIPGLLAALLVSRPLEILETGRDTAASLGVNPRFILLAVAALVLLLTSAAVAVSGPILFAGLVVPHMARFWLGDRLWRQLLGSILLGALLLLVADALGMRLDGQDRLPPSLALTLLGGPWFLMLVRRRYRAC